MHMVDTGTDLPRIRVRNQHSIVADVLGQLLTYLVSKKIRPGEKLPSERALSEQLGLGRSAVREAVKALHLLGIVDVRQGDGTYLRSTDSDVLPQILEWGLLLGQRRTEDLVDAREVLEVYVARRAAGHPTPEGLDRMDQCLAAMEHAKRIDNADAFARADVEFHLAIAEMADNTVISDVLRSIRTLLHVWVRKVLAAEGPLDTIEQHREIADAIRAGDVEASGASMHSHITTAGKRLRDALPADGEGL